MSDFENSRLRHIVGTGDVPEIRDPKSSTIPKSAVPIKGSINETCSSNLTKGFSA